LKSKKRLITLLLVLTIAAIYSYPVPQHTFEDLATDVNPATRQSLLAFRQAHPPQKLQVDDLIWDYLVLGQGEETILFLHGMTGAYDIWWQQMEALSDHYRVISVTYPAADTLEEMSRGVLSILDREGIQTFNVVGSSLGGYFAQYLITHHPERIEKAVFANTFPPNNLIPERNKTIGIVLPYLPAWLIMNVMRDSMENSVYPAAQIGDAGLVLAFGLEQTFGRMTKAQLIARFRCVVEPFEAANPAEFGIPVMIIEADNDPLVEPALREQLKAAYPSAQVHTLHNAGHFSYLNIPHVYTQLLAAFFAQK